MDYTAIHPQTWNSLVELMDIMPETLVRYHRFGFQETFYFNSYSKYVSKDVVISDIKGKIVDGIAITPNNFPYSRLLAHLPFVKHFVLWSDHELTKEEISTHLNSHFAPHQYCYYENRPEQKSLPEVFHVQLFVNFESSTNWLDFTNFHYPIPAPE
jgi:hypothetical protein